MVGIIILITFTTAVVAALFSIFIIFACNRDIEGMMINEKDYISKSIRYPFIFLLSSVIVVESAVYTFISKFPSLLMGIVTIGVILFLYFSICKKCLTTQPATTKQDMSFFEGLYLLLIYSIFVVIFTTIMVLIIGEIFNSTQEMFINLYILLSLIFLFSMIFTYLMTGYLGSLLLGCISGIGLFLIFFAWVFKIYDINLGILPIPIYVPASSFLGVLCHMFVSLHYTPSKLSSESFKERLKNDDLKIRGFVARIFASMVLGLFVYSATVTGDSASYTYMLFGFASGFYISPILRYLRKKIFSLFDVEGLKADDREEIKGYIQKNPQQYSILSNDEIKRIADQTGMGENELRDFIKKLESERIKKDVQENPQTFSLLSDDEIKRIAGQTGMDENELKKRRDFIRNIGARVAKELMKEHIYTREDFLFVTGDKLEKICKDQGIDYKSLMGKKSSL